jgi:CheY-like chemotaxis protein
MNANWVISDLLLDWVTKSGNVRHMMISSNARLCEDGRLYARSFNRDDTDRVLREMVKSLKTTQDCFEAVNTAKDTFIRRIFHELKTPLHIVAEEIASFNHQYNFEANNIINNKNNNNDNINNDNKNHHQHINNLKKHIESICGIVDDISFATSYNAQDKSIDNTIYQFEAHNLVHFIENIIATVQETEIDDDKQDTITNIFVDIDEKLRQTNVLLHPRLSRVLFHLIQNAITYAKASGIVKIKLSVLASSKDDIEVHFKVSNVCEMPVNMHDIELCFHTYFSNTKNNNNQQQKKVINNNNNNNSVIVDSLTSIQGKRLGLYVAYNKLAIMSSKLECFYLNNECNFTFKLNFKTVKTCDDASKIINIKNHSNTALLLHPKIHVQFNIDNIDNDINNINNNNKINSLHRAEELSIEKTNKKKEEVLRRILVVDDSLPIVKMMSKMLTKKGFIVDVAYNGQTACDMLATNNCKNNNEKSSSYDINSNSYNSISSKNNSSNNNNSNNINNSSSNIDNSKNVSETCKNSNSSNNSKNINSCDNNNNNNNNNNSSSNNSNDIKICNNNNATIACPYDVVLMDLRMPVMDGLTATLFCRNELNLKKLPIIIITAEVGLSIQKEVENAGATAFLQKPVKIENIIEVINTLLLI